MRYQLLNNYKFHKDTALGHTLVKSLLLEYFLSNLIWVNLGQDDYFVCILTQLSNFICGDNKSGTRLGKWLTTKERIRGSEPGTIY